MSARLDARDALTVVQVVLARYEVSTSDGWDGDTPPEWVDSLVECVCDATREDAVSDSLRCYRGSELDRRKERIGGLNELLKSFRGAGDRIKTRKRLRLAHERDLDSVLQDMQALLDAEKLIVADHQIKLQQSDSEARRERGGRRRDPRYEAGENMYRILHQAGVVSWDKAGAWKAGKIIAEMFIEAGIEHRTRDAVQKYLAEKRLVPLL